LRIFEEEKEKIMIQNEKQISMLLTEPEALCYSDAINLLHSCLPPANKEIIDKAIENIMAALKFGAYSQETIEEMSSRIEIMAKFFRG
jgi:hypothetical protein